MPRKTKEQEILKEKKEKVSTSVKKSPTIRKTTKKVDSKNTSSASTISAKKVTSKKAPSKTSSKKSNSSVKVSSKTPAKKTGASSKKVSKFVPEYYDLPYRYNETIVRILAQTPKTLFVYWDISDTDRSNFVQSFGSDFFNKTVPVLLIHNLTDNYTFEIEISDFANSWYFDISDAKCEYQIELGRRVKRFENYSVPDNYVYVASSNKIEAPNDRILFDKVQNTLYFKNVKTNNIACKNIDSFEFIHRIGKIYNIYNLYKKIYKSEEILDLNNPSSGNPTSTFK